MEVRKTTKIQKIWDNFSLEKSWESFIVDYSIPKKMFLSFQPGPCYYWLLNAKTATFELMSNEVEKVLGYTPQEALFPFLLNQVHPDDLPYLLEFENNLSIFFTKLPVEKRYGYKIQYDFRIRRKDGMYVRILNQMLMVKYNAATNTIHTFGIHTDISHLKKDNKPVLSFIALDNNDVSYLDVENCIVNSILSKREKQVLELMLEGLISKEICIILNISKHTVDSHRKKMMQKSNSKSIPELIKKAILNRWV